MWSSFHIRQKQYGTTVQYTQSEINDYSVEINISSKKNSVKSVTKKKFFYADLVQKTTMTTLL
jgi:hypothetical protein